MASSPVNDIEDAFAQLPPEAQLGLLERLVHRVRVNITGLGDKWDAELSAMAADPQVQRELQLISSEFSGTETDGLERD